jgi:hypothetical protein
VIIFLCKFDFEKERNLEWPFFLWYSAQAHLPGESQFRLQIWPECPASKVRSSVRVWVRQEWLLPRREVQADPVLEWRTQRTEFDGKWGRRRPCTRLDRCYRRASKTWQKKSENFKIANHFNPVELLYLINCNPPTAHIRFQRPSQYIIKI